MKLTLQTKIYVLGQDVDTDQIIPAQHLAIPLGDPEQRARYGGLALTGVPGPQAGLPQGHIPFADPHTNHSPYGIVLAGRNFGCGSSREHAPVALAEAGVRAVVAGSYARIFYRNAIDGGYFPPFEYEEELREALAKGELHTGDAVVLDAAGLDAAGPTLEHPKSGRTFRLRPLGAAGEIIEAGGLFAYARATGAGKGGGKGLAP